MKKVFGVILLILSLVGCTGANTKEPTFDPNYTSVTTVTSKPKNIDVEIVRESVLIEDSTIFTMGTPIIKIKNIGTEMAFINWTNSSFNNAAATTIDKVSEITPSNTPIIPGGEVEGAVFAKPQYTIKTQFVFGNLVTIPSVMPLKAGKYNAVIEIVRGDKRDYITYIVEIVDTRKL